MHDMLYHETALMSGQGVDSGQLVGTLAFALRRAQAAVAEDFAARFAEEHIRPAHYSLMLVLDANPGLRQSQLSDVLGLQRTNLVPLLDELEERGLVERRRVERDRRAASVVLTDHGAEVLLRLRRIAEQHEARFTHRLGGPDSRYSLMGLLTRLAEPNYDV
jgi:DNA-binding MarR family transcriptional regulator